jgi:hypothetical protein
MRHTAVVFRSGAYGTFISWCVFAFSSLNNRPLVSPIDSQNSGHLFLNDPGNNEVTSIHQVEDLFDHYLILEYNKIKGINYIVNYFEKFHLSKLESYLSWTFPDLLGVELVEPIWKIRELLSFRILDMIDAEYSSNERQTDFIKNLNSPWYSIVPEEFLLSPAEHLEDIYKKFSLEKNQLFNQVDQYIQPFVLKQKYFNRHIELENFINCTVNNISAKLEFTTIIDEAYIQAILRVRGYEIKCYNLNYFPLDSTTLHSLIDK